MDRLKAANGWTKVFFEDGQKYRIQVRAQLIQLGSNPKPHFSITGEVERLAKNGRKVFQSGGCIHEEILQHFPHLKPLVDLHLSNQDGVPSHAFDNAGYWAGNTGYNELNLKQLAKHLQISTELAQEMVEYVQDFYGEFDDITTYQDAWQNTCEDFELPAIWKKQADEALAMLNPVFEEVTK
jgi:hypothetical protein